MKDMFTMDGTATDDTIVSKLTVQIEPLDNPAPSNTVKLRIEKIICESFY